MAANCICSASVRFPNTSRRLSITSLSGFIVPSVLVMAIPYWSIAVATSSVGLLRRASTLLSAVPDCDPFMPAFAIRPSATVTSSTV